MRDGLYAVPALVAAAITVIAILIGFYGLPAALTAAAACFLIRLLGVHFGLHAPRPPEQPGRREPPKQG
ncbi:hypothetical protein [Paenarthrobacter sp. Z7-10]|uniref:hypothetical protein n=1 Tax=Paenarthrobacter sp. Z7-10 TaxID=2787635 RepID=UPI003FA68AC0